MDAPQQSSPPVQYVSVSLRAFGLRAQADGRTGLAAWRIIRKRHPLLTWLAGAYDVLLVGLAVALVVHLVP
ncbi:hypothetical protein [Streptomyces sp. NPDC001020]